MSELKKTRFYQEALEEGRREGKLEVKLEMVPQLLQRGFSLEEVAELLELEIETIRVHLQQ